MAYVSDGCQGIECKHNSVCRVDPADGVGQCVCPSSCPNVREKIKRTKALEIFHLRIFFTDEVPSMWFGQDHLSE